MHGQVVPVHALECVGIEIEVLRQALLECDLTFTGEVTRAMPMYCAKYVVVSLLEI